MKIYTKTGDDGTTGILGGARTSKTSARINAIGDVDELNACLGLCRGQDMAWIQSVLFEIGAELASPPGGRIESRTVSSTHAERLEHQIDAMTGDLPPLKNFILPGGSGAAANLHLARAVCRRAERSVLVLHNEEPQRMELLVFLNRLSDWLFVAARTANAREGVPDVAWQKP
jgi:cob(I)alamin adenosyltransferase